MYLSGTLLVEALTAIIWVHLGAEGIVYRLTTHVEELLEMGGLILFLRSGLDLLKPDAAGTLAEYNVRITP